MTAAFDLDGTISAYPQICGFLAHGIRRNGGKVVVLTGAVRGVGPGHDRAFRMNQLHEVNWNVGVDFDELVIAVGDDVSDVAREKAKWMKENSAEIFIDDTALFLMEAKKTNPGMLVLGVVPPQ